MKKKSLYKFGLLITAIVFVSFLRPVGEEEFVNENFQFASQQLHKALLTVNAGSAKFPRTVDSNGNLVKVNIYDWTSGFFPGSLWYTYEQTKDGSLLTPARRWTEALEPLQTFTGHHDIGFMMYCSYGNAYRISRNATYKKILIQSARSLCTRFNATAGCIKSWNRFRPWHADTTTYSFPVIIDNLMNLELLFFASKITGDTSFRHIAVTHANNTLKNHVRKNYSSYHVVCYDTLTGKVETKNTAQGYADNSTWARGQSWGLYGFTMTYRETGNKEYLKTAQGMADWIINNLPEDKIPYWDYNIGEQGFTPPARSYAPHVSAKLRDASAAAIAASALLELSTFSGAKGKKYKETAIQILHVLAGNTYKANLGTNGNFLLMHSVGSVPNKSEIDVPLVYADYYFLEALQRYDRLLKGRNLIDPVK